MEKVHRRGKNLTECRFIEFQLILSCNLITPRTKNLFLRVPRGSEGRVEKPSLRIGENFYSYDIFSASTSRVPLYLSQQVFAGKRAG